LKDFTLLHEQRRRGLSGPLDGIKTARDHSTRPQLQPRLSPKRRRLTKSPALEDPLEYFLNLIIDDDVPRMQRQTVQKRLRRISIPG